MREFFCIFKYMKSIFYYIFNYKEYKVLLTKHILLNKTCQTCNNLSSNNYCMISLNKIFTNSFVTDINGHTCEEWDLTDGKLKLRVGTV